MTDQSREQFEAHFALSQRQAKRDNAGDYIDEKVRDKWEGWQAGRTSVYEALASEAQANGNDVLAAQIRARSISGIA